MRGMPARERRVDGAGSRERGNCAHAELQRSARAQDRPVPRPTKGGRGSRHRNPPNLLAHCNRLRSVSPERSLLATKPNAPLAAIRLPYSRASRLETSTMLRPPSTASSRAATSNPSTSGSWMSSRTSSGSSASTSASAVVPVSASPTTSKPSSVSSARAQRRKLGWSSTISALIDQSHCQQPAVPAVRITPGYLWFDGAMPQGPQEGAIRLAGSPSLYVEGSPQWVSVAWEDGGTRHPLGSGVPEALSSSITGFLEAIRTGAVTSESAEWVLSVARPNRALFGKPGPGDGEVSLIWQPA